MKVIETKVYNFSELSPSAKEKAREWYREGAFDYDWWEFIYYDAKTIARLMGIEIDKIYFSGFWSQGDGACFEGKWRARDVKRDGVKGYAPQDTELHRIAVIFEELAEKFPESYFGVKHRGHYYHENCTEFSCDFGDDTENHKPDDMDTAEDTMKEAARDFMRWIYRQLEKEYDYLNADEQVDKMIEANEYTFTEDGKRFG